MQKMQNGFALRIGVAGSSFNSGQSREATNPIPVRHILGILLSGGRRNVSWEPVYRVVKKIPRGHVTTYGEIAKSIRQAGGARAVGYAMASCPGGRGIPWHRVVSAGGHLRMPEPHVSLQRRLLAAEGIPLDRRSIDLKLFGWSPAKKRVRKRRLKRAKPPLKRRRPTKGTHRKQRRD
jgi:methylated-DNA-protein-cysteine methyltransferase-like protein